MRILAFGRIARVMWRRHSCLPRRDSSRRTARVDNASQASRRVSTRQTRVPAPRLIKETVRRSQAGVTLIELVVVMAIISLLVGITYPCVAARLETVRLSSAADSVASFINAALNRVERRQEVIAMGISVKDNTIMLHSADAAFERKLELPDGISIQAVLPQLPQADASARQVVLMPGGTTPRLGILIVNRKA